MYRNSTVMPSTWLNDNEFIGVLTNKSGDIACYGWSKTGSSFFVYEISHGHIEKAGTIKRSELLDYRSLSV